MRLDFRICEKGGDTVKSNFSFRLLQSRLSERFMASNKKVMAGKKAKKLESAISLFILAVIISIVAAMVLRQFQSTATEAIANGPEGFKGLKIEEYSAENLYEKINGKAPLYLEAGFKKLTTQRFVSADDESIWMENYVYEYDEWQERFFGLQYSEKEQCGKCCKYRCDRGLQD